MLLTTDAIVLSLQPHSDKAHVLHAYTRAGGRVNYMVYGLGRKNAIGKYMPLSLIQITADHPVSGLPTLREASSLTAQRSYSEPCLGPTAQRSYSASDPHKQAISLFIAEVLYHVLRHPMTDEPMFDFLAQAIQSLDTTNEPQNFHLQFLADFAAKLGFAIDPADPSNPLISNPLILSPETRQERQKQLRALCSYFEEHVETWQTPKSLDVLMEVFD